MKTSLTLKIRSLSVNYGSKNVVDCFDLEVNNEIIVLFGPSGSGKTTILKSILGVIEKDSTKTGSIQLGGKDITNANGEVGMVFQGPILPTWIMVQDLCRMGCNMRNLPKEIQNAYIYKMLNRFGINHLAKQYPRKLSGGEKQRVAISITLLNNPQILLLDEPTSFLDGLSRISIWSYIETQARLQNIPIVIVSHDPDEAIYLGDKIYILGNPAHVLDCIDIPFLHPRSPALFEDPAFWKIKKKLIGDV